MSWRNLIIALFLLAGMLPLMATSPMEEEVMDSRTEMALRKIGHEVLLCAGDTKSRVLPIEKVGYQYKISFASEFGFDPENFITIIEDVMTETGIADSYLVAVKQCSTNEIVHSFEVGNADLQGCVGRVLPEDCYSIFMTLLQHDALIATGPATTKEDATLSSARTLSYLLLPLVFLIGFIGYFSTKKQGPNTDPEPDPDRCVPV